MAAKRADLEEIQALDRAHLIHPINEFQKHEKQGSRLFTGGQGVELTLADGRSVIDGFSGLFNISVGHGRTEIAEAVAAQMRKLAYYPSFWDFGNEPAARLAGRLVELLPADRGLRHMLFHTSGSEANEANFTPTGQSICYSMKHCIYGGSCVCFGQIGCFGNICNKIIFVHG